MVDKTLIWGSAFALGVLLASFFDFGFALVLFLLLLAAVLGVAWHLTQNPHSRYQLKISFIILLLLALGIGRLYLANSQFTKGAALLVPDETASLIGVISAEPDERENSTRLTVKLRDYDTKILLVTDLYPEYHYGDELEFAGKLELPEDFETDTGRLFHYQNYLRKDGISYLMYRPKIEVLGEGGGNFVLHQLFKVKGKFLEHLGQALPEPHASLAGGLILGTKRSLGDEILSQFRTVGLIHIVVLSGYNITIVAENLTRTVSYLFTKTLSLSFGVVGIVLFALLVGGGATVVRASIMAILVLVARASYRTYNINRALTIAGVAMLLHNPFILAFDPSFQLSFLATLGLLYVSPLITPRVSWITERYQLREVVTATIATQIFVLPFILYLTGDISLVALPANILVLGAIPLTMFFGFMTGLVGFVATWLAWPFGFISYLLLSYELTVTDWLSRIPLAKLSTGQFPFALVLLVYVFYGWLIWRLSKKAKVDKGG